VDGSRLQTSACQLQHRVHLHPNGTGPVEFMTAEEAEEKARACREAAEKTDRAQEWLYGECLSSWSSTACDGA
jgi:hypothetical protein